MEEIKQVFTPSAPADNGMDFTAKPHDVSNAAAPQIKAAGTAAATVGAGIEPANAGIETPDGVDEDIKKALAAAGTPKNAGAPKEGAAKEANAGGKNKSFPSPDAFAAHAAQTDNEADGKPAPDPSAAHTETDFEKFLKQFPEADAHGVVEGTLRRGDFTEGAFTREYVRSLRERIARLEEENASEEAVLKRARDSRRVTEEIIKDYLAAVDRAAKGVRPAPSGQPASTPPAKPHSINEAGKLATDILNLG